eukprot:3059967-Prymnesium_polylepis.1
MARWSSRVAKTVALLTWAEGWPSLHASQPRVEQTFGHNPHAMPVVLPSLSKYSSRLCLWAGARGLDLRGPLVASGSDVCTSRIRLFDLLPCRNFLGVLPSQKVPHGLFRAFPPEFGVSPNFTPRTVKGQ